MTAFPGLISETLKSGLQRWRVRVAGDPKKRITISVGPGHYDFARQYHDARAGHATAADAIASLGQTGDVDRHIQNALRSARLRSAKRGREFEIGPSDVLRLIETQGATCAISAIKFDLRPNSANARRPFALSIDRVDAKHGYTPQNVRLVCTIVNIGRGDWTDSDYIRACTAVAAKHAIVPRDKK